MTTSLSTKVKTHCYDYQRTFDHKEKVYVTEELYWSISKDQNTTRKNVVIDGETYMLSKFKEGRPLLESELKRMSRKDEDDFDPDTDIPTKYRATIKARAKIYEGILLRPPTAPVYRKWLAKLDRGENIFYN